MATTTNYGWTTPDDTALVKDGAAAIRTLGSSVDTTTKALNPSTTLGDIEYRSSTANTNTRLGIGTTGQVLAVSGGVPAWTTPSTGGGMTLISTTTLSGANPSLTSIPGTYKNLLLVFGNVTASSGNTYLQVGFNGSTTLFSGVYVLDNGVGQRIDDVVTFTRLYLKNTGGKNGGYLEIFNYASTVINKSVTYGGNSEASTNAITGGQGAGYLNTTSAITSLQLIFNDASALAGGTAYLYGVA